MRGMAGGGTTAVTHFQRILSQATGLDMAALVVRERPALAYQSNRLYDVWVGDRHLIAKEYLQPDELAVAPLGCRKRP
jgi:hypothetical protein